MTFAIMKVSVSEKAILTICCVIRLQLRRKNLFGAN